MSQQQTSAVAVAVPALLQNNIILPPPIVQRVRAVDPSNNRIPGEIILSQQNQLLRGYLEYAGFTGDLIETFDMWLTRSLPHQIASRVINTGDGRIARVRRIHPAKPTATDDKGMSIPMTPQIARERSLTYDAALYADWELVRPATATEPEVVEETLNNCHIGKIPIMLGSTWCHLAGKSDQERLELGECPTDPLGYFIIKGTERVILIQEKLRLNRVLIFLDKTYGPICRMTCPTPRGTSIVTVYKNSDNAIKIYLAMFGRTNNVWNSIPVFWVFKMIGEAFPELGVLTDPNVILQLVTQYIPDNLKRKVLFALQASLIEFSSVGDVFQEVADIMDLRGDILEAKAGTKEIRKLSSEQRIQLAMQLSEQLFPNMVNETLTAKLQQLCLMIAEYTLFMIGQRKIDDRDSWSNKRLETAGRSVEQLFGGLWGRFCTEAENSLTSSKRQVTLDNIIRAFNLNVLGTEFESSFDSNNWGIRGSRMKENITDILKRDSVLALYSHLTRINTPTSARAKSATIRRVQMSQLGYVCTIETPEGARCGLVKAKTVGCYVSIERDDNVIREYIADYLSDSQDVDKRHVCLLNGKWMGWCSGETLRDHLVNLRRSGDIYRDTAIVISGVVLYVNCDSSRPTRPLLIVDPDGRLVIEKKKLWGKPFIDLLDQGAAEYVDAFEQEEIMLAESLDAIDMRRREIREAKSRRNEVNRLVARMQSTFDPNYLPQQVRTTENGQIYFEESNVENSTLVPLADLSEQQVQEVYQMTLNKVIEDAQATEEALNRMLERPAYTHCELDPTAIFGIAASIIPLPNHNQAPRNVYQCCHTLEQILMPDGSTKPIKDLKDGDQVVVVDPITHEHRVSKIKNYFNVPIEVTGQHMLEITTISGRVLRVTNQHPVLTYKDPLNGLKEWTRAGDLKVGSLVCAVVTQDYQPHTDDATVVLDLPTFVSKCIDLGIKPNIVEKHSRALADLGLLPLIASDNKLPIIARLFGLMCTDGSINVNKNNYSTGSFCLGTEQDALELANDITALGLTPGKIFFSQSTIVDKETKRAALHSAWTSSCPVLLSSLLLALDISYGRKTTNPTKPIPDWIMNGSKLVKREFLAGYQGGDGCKMVANVQERVLLPNTVQHKIPEHMDSLKNFYGQMVELLSEFGIVSHVDQGKDPAGIYAILKMSDTLDNLILFGDKIGYRYASTKASRTAHLSEYLRYKRNTLKQKQETKDLVLELFDSGLNKAEVAREVGLTYSVASGIIRSRDREIFFPREGLKPSQWLDQTMAQGTCVYVPVESIRLIHTDNVCDFETEDPAHSFVASGILNHNCSMGKQALGLIHSAHHIRFETTAKMLAYPSRPLFETQINQMIGMNEQPAGETVIVAIMTYGGYNQEDAIIFNQASIDRGLFNMIIYRSYKSSESQKGNISETFGVPPLGPKDDPEKYKHLDENGIAKIGSKIKPGQVLIGKVRKNKQTNTVSYPNEVAGIGEEGIVDSILVTTNSKGNKMVKVKIRQYRSPVIGDKFASRYAQKGTIGLIMPEVDMPFTQQGVKPDIIINPHSIPSRMTIGKLLEIVTSKTAAFTGERVNAGAFNKFNIDEFTRQLTEYGYQRHGNEKLTSGLTGRPLQASIFMGPCYYQALRHHVKDKIQQRSRGAIKPFNRQPVQGRSNGGGLRLIPASVAVVNTRQVPVTWSNIAKFREHPYKIAPAA